jgi:hypothetical protein
MNAASKAFCSKAVTHLHRVGGGSIVINIIGRHCGASGGSLLCFKSRITFTHLVGAGEAGIRVNWLLGVIDTDADKGVRKTEIQLAQNVKRIRLSPEP